MAVKITLFLKEWMLCAYTRSHSALTFYHPTTHRLLIELEPIAQGFAVYDEEGMRLGELRPQGFHSCQKERHLYLTMQTAQVSAYHFYEWQDLTIGRGEDCDISLKDPYVSLYHCVLRVERETVVLSDQGSTNGTYVNGRRARCQTLAIGDVVAIGDFQLMIGPGFFAALRSLALTPFTLHGLLKKEAGQSKEIVWLQEPQAISAMSMPEPDIGNHQGVQPLLLQLGPGLSMALCSLLAMQSSQVNAWLQAGIVLSMVVWPLLSAFHQRVRRHMERRRMRNRYAAALASWKQTVATVWESQMALRKSWRTQLCEAMVCVRGSPVQVCLGERRQTLNPKLPKISDGKEKRCWQLAMKAKEEVYQEESSPLLFAFPSLIWIVGEKGMDYALFVLMQLLKQLERVQLYAAGFASLETFGRGRFLRCYHPLHARGDPHREREELLARLREKPKEEYWILLCEENAYQGTMTQFAHTYCIVVSHSKRRLDQSGIVVDLQANRYWDKGWHSLRPLSYAPALWQSFCAFMESDQTFCSPHPGDFLSLFQCSSAKTLPILEQWEKRKEHTLAALIGWEDNGEPIVLDAHERADGPHGIMAGTTGSGKSELLLTYILSLSVSYPPDQVGFFLIDYKGGAMAKALDALPHIRGVMTNLQQASLQRVRISLSQELTFRQQLFQQMMELHALSTMSLEQYERCRRQEDPVLGHLFIIVDEFAQLRQEQGAFLTDLQRIARIGRSLGMHLLLCTQKPGGVIDDQIWSNSRFHLCLRVQDAGDSRDMLHRNDALKLRRSGEFLLQVGDDERFVHGYGAYANADYCPTRGYRPNYVHQLRIFDRNAKLLYHHTWRMYQSQQKQLPVLCQHMQALAKGRYTLRDVCMEELDAYSAHTPFCADMQIGWIDRPQMQQIDPLTIHGRSMLVLTLSSQDACRLLHCCVHALEKSGKRRWYYLGEPKGDMEVLSMREERSVWILLHHLTYEEEDACLLVESLDAWKHAPHLLERLAVLANRHQLILVCQQIDYGLLSLLPPTLTKMSFANVQESVLREWFGEGRLPMMTYDHSGILSDGALYGYLCVPWKGACLQKQNGVKSLLQSKAAQSIGVREDGTLFFWKPMAFTLVLYGDETMRAWVCELVERWQRKDVEKASTVPIIGCAQERELQELANAHRYDGWICWLGAGMEEYGYACGFRTTRCEAGEMVLRAAGKEERIRLWEGGE